MTSDARATIRRMAKLMVLECDRCGLRVESVNELAQMSVSPAQPARGRRRPPIVFDLCADCCGGALDWVGLRNGKAAKARAGR